MNIKFVSKVKFLTFQIDFGDAKKEGEADPVEENKLADNDGGMNAELFADMVGKDIERKGTFVGTVNYLAPEMIKDSDATCASDLWALGCIIFKMYTGKVPFPGMSETACFPIIL